MSDSKQIGVRHGIWRALSLLEHGRLMGLLMCLALAAGLTFFVYSRAVYQSRALIRFQVIDLPLRTSARAEGEVDARSLRDRLAAPYLIERTARRLGLTKELGNYETIRDSYLPKLEVSLVDHATLAVDVFAYDPMLVGRWQPAMLNEFEEYGREMRQERRKELTQVYNEELEELTKRMEKQAQEKFSFEQENSITELFVQQAGLTQLPREMVVTRHRLDQMDQTRSALDGENLSPSRALEILSSFQLDPNLGSPLGMPLPPPGQGSAALEQLVPSTADRGGPGIVVMPSSAPSSQDWQVIEKDRQDVLVQVQEARKKYLPGHQIMRELQAKLDQLNGSIESQATFARARFNAEYLKLQGTLRRLEEQLPDYRDINRKYEEFRRSFGLQQNKNLAWDEAYKQLAGRLTTMDYTGDAVPIQLEFIGFSLMRDKDPVSPPKMKLLYMSLALGLALAVGVPFAMQLLNDTMTRLEDTQDALQLTGLGVVPVYGTSELENIVRSAAIGSDHPDRLLEDFRLIRSSIALNRDMDLGTQVIMVSSARPGEGKSTIASNLAWAFASMGDRTLLVDCDLRRGRLHRILDISNEFGLTEVLERKREWTGAVQTTALGKLDMLTRGPFHVGATERLCQGYFSELVSEWRKHYQRVILDTPPVLGLSEASSLQRVVDGTVLVILSEQTPRRDVEQALDILKKSGGRMYGFVLNRLDLKKAANYYQYSYYSPYYYDQAPESVR